MTAFRRAWPILALLLAIPLFADTIVMKNGERVEGRIVSEDGDEVKVEIQKKGMTLIASLKRSEIAEIQQTVANPNKDEFAQRLAEARKLPAGTEQTLTLLELGRWAREVALYEEAIVAFEECKSSLSGFEDVADYEVACTQLASKDFDGCKTTLQRILERNPNHEDARILADDLGKDVQDSVAEDVQKGFEYYVAGNCRRALGVFERFVKDHSRDEVDILSKACQEKAGQPLSALMIDCRFRQGCPEGCKFGFKPCTRGSCRAGRNLEFHKPVEGDITVRAFTITYCGACKGLGRIICEKCGGTGISLGRPSEFEKPDFVVALVDQAEKSFDEAKQLALNGTVAPKDPPKDGAGNVAPPVGVTAPAPEANPMSVLARGVRSRRFYRTVSTIAPGTPTPGGQNLFKRMGDIDDFLFEKASRYSSEYTAKAETEYEKAVGYNEAPTLVDRHILQSRIDHARTAVEDAEQARLFCMYVLKDAQSSVSPGMADVQLKLDAATRTAKRCHDGYEALCEIQAYLESLSQEDMTRIWGNVWRQVQAAGLTKDNARRALNDLRNDERNR